MRLLHRGLRPEKLAELGAEVEAAFADAHRLRGSGKQLLAGGGLIRELRSVGAADLPEEILGRRRFRRGGDVVREVAQRIVGGG